LSAEAGWNLMEAAVSHESSVQPTLTLSPTFSLSHGTGSGSPVMTVNAVITLSFPRTVIDPSRGVIKSGHVIASMRPSRSGSAMAGPAASDPTTANDTAKAVIVRFIVRFLPARGMEWLHCVTGAWTDCSYHPPRCVLDAHRSVGRLDEPTRRRLIQERRFNDWGND